MSDVNNGERSLPVMWVGTGGVPLIPGPSPAVARKSLDGERIEYQQIVDANGNPITEIPGGGGGGGGGGVDLRANIDYLGNNMAAIALAVAAAYTYSIPVTGYAGVKVTLTGPINFGFEYDPVGSPGQYRPVDVDLMYKPIWFGYGIGNSVGDVAYSDGSIARGHIIDLGWNPTTDKFHRKVIRVIGDHLVSADTQPTPCTAVRIVADQRAVTTYDVGVTRHFGDAIQIEGDSEKKSAYFQISHIVGGYGLTFRTTVATASADEWDITYVGTSMDKLLLVQNAYQVSMSVKFVVESVAATNNLPAIFSQGRKAEKYSGEIRGVNGRLFQHDTVGSGESAAGAVLIFDLLVIQHYWGDIRIYNAKSVSGKITHTHVKTDMPLVGSLAYPAGTTPTNGPSFIIGEVEESCELFYETRRNQSPIGARIGDTTYVNPNGLVGSPFSRKKIRLGIAMGSDEGSTIPQTDAKLHTAADIALGTGSIVEFVYIQGNITIQAGWQEGLITVPANFIRDGYVVSFPGQPVIDAVTEFVVLGPMYLTEFVGLAWAFRGLTIQCVRDMGGATMRFNGTQWEILATLAIPNVSMEALGSPWNSDRLKRFGLLVTSNENFNTYVATGSGGSDSWKGSDASVVNPGYLTLTNSYETRVIAAGGAALATIDKLIYDRLIHDLLAIKAFNPADLPNSPIVGLHFMSGPTEQAGLENILGAYWQLVKSGTFVFSAYRGFQPANPNVTNAHLRLSDWPTDQKGIDENNLAFGACAEELNGAGNPYQTMGANVTSISVVMHRGDGGNNARLNRTSGFGYPQVGIQGVGERLGIAWGKNASQTMRMVGGPEITSVKNTTANTMTQIYYGRAGNVYLPFRLSMGLVGTGNNWTRDILKGALDALKFARDSLIARI